MSVQHPIPPLFNADSEILILGSFPSVKSRETGFFYGHPQNRFWKVLATVCGKPLPQTVEEKKNLVLSHRLALWDVIASCEIEGSSDSSIHDVVPNDLLPMLKNSRIQRVFVNGTTAAKLYQRFLFPTVKIPAVTLPSTSPANASWSLERLCDTWGTALKIRKNG